MKKRKVIKTVAVILLLITMLTFASDLLMMLSFFDLLPIDIFDTSYFAMACCAGAGTLTGAAGFYLMKLSEDQNEEKEEREKNVVSVRKSFGLLLMSVAFIALNYSLYLILYYFDIIPNRNLGFIDISHVVAGIVAAPATAIGALGLWLFKKK